MGNCCKKKKFEKNNNESNFINNEKYKPNNNNQILTIKNLGGKNFKDKEDEKDENKNKMIDYELDNNNINSSTKLNKKDKKYDNNEGRNKYSKLKIDKKYIKKYSNILLNYIILNEKINYENKLTLYIINKTENEDIINLYNEVIKNEEYIELNSKKDSKKNKIIEDIVTNYLLEGKQINSLITVYNYEQCMKLKNKIIDLVDCNFIKAMSLTKKNETKCIEYYKENGLIFMILQFKENHKKVKIEKRDKVYFIRELDENNYKYNNKNSLISEDYEIIKKVSLEIKENKNNCNINSEGDIVVNKNNLIEDKDGKNNSFHKNINDIIEDKTFSLNTIKFEIKSIFNNKNSKEIENKNENKEDDIYITFKILLLFSAQNNNILLKEGENEYYYLINKNIITNIKNEINNKNNNNISLIINDYIIKNKHKKFEEFFKNINNVIQEFEKENINLFKNEYDFKKIKFKEFIPNNNEIINSIKDTKIIYPLNFILIKPEIYNFFIKFISFEEESNKNNIEALNKVLLFLSGNQIYLKNIKKEEDIIYVCNIIKNDNEKYFQIEEINISYILIYNLKNTFMKEYNLFIKDNDFFNYISKRKLKTNFKETTKIINEEKEEIGFFINLEKNNDLNRDINNKYSEKIDNKIESDKNKNININYIKNNNNSIKNKYNNNIDEEENLNKLNNNLKDKEIKDITNNSDIFFDIDSPNNSGNNIDNSIDKNIDINNNQNNSNTIISIENNNYDLIIENNDIENHNKDWIQEYNNFENNKDLIEENDNIENGKDLIKKKNNLENKNNLSINLVESNETYEEKIKNEEDKKEVLIGLKNHKNDSYATSLLQCLYNYQYLTNFFISNNKFKIIANDNINNKEFIEKDNNNDDNQINENSLSYKYYEVIYHLYYKKQDSKIIKSYDPINFIEYIENIEPTFKKNRYKCPKKLFVFMINNLQKELNQKENTKDMEALEYLSNIAISIQPNVDNSYKLFQTYLNDFNYKNNSIIDKCFSGIKSNIMACQKCSNIDYLFKPFYFFIVSLTQLENEKDENGKITLNKFFEKNYSKDKSVLNNLDKLCNNCNQITNFSFSNQIFLAPKLLVIILDDAKEKGDCLKLIFNLDINNYLIEKNNGYELIGIITYFMEIGMNVNYMAYCKIKENEKWYYFCDDCIYDVKENRLEIDMENRNSLPYILFYKEINTNNF